MRATAGAFSTGYRPRSAACSFTETTPDRSTRSARTRNEGRVRRLEALRIERAARRDRVGKVGLELAQGERSGRLVADLDEVGKRYGDKRVVEKFSGRILRGDKVGLIGPNGSGK